jgi:hypothetical protein
MEDLLLPIYTTALFVAYPNSYTPGVFGVSLTDSKGYHCALIGISRLLKFRSFYTKFMIDSNTNIVRGNKVNGIPVSW